MSLQESPRFIPPERLHPIDAAKSAKQPDWNKLELIGEAQIKSELDKRIGDILGKDKVEVQLAEINLAWPYSQVSDKAKAHPGDLHNATFESMLSFGFDPTKKEDKEPQYIDNHGCRREIVVYKSNLFPGLFFFLTKLVSNYASDRNLVVKSSWKAVFEKPKNGLIQELLGRLNVIIPIAP